MKIALYTTLGCHLCEQALALLHEAQGCGYCFEITKVEIADSDQLIEKYGIRIPVISNEDGNELGWPFDSATLSAFLQSTGT